MGEEQGYWVRSEHGDARWRCWGWRYRVECEMCLLQRCAVNGYAHLSFLSDNLAWKATDCASLRSPPSSSVNRHADFDRDPRATAPMVTKDRSKMLVWSCVSPDTPPRVEALAAERPREAS